MRAYGCYFRPRGGANSRYRYDRQAMGNADALTGTASTRLAGVRVANLGLAILIAAWPAGRRLRCCSATKRGSTLMPRARSRRPLSDSMGRQLLSGRCGSPIH